MLRREDASCKLTARLDMRIKNFVRDRWIMH